MYHIDSTIAVGENSIVTLAETDDFCDGNDCYVSYPSQNRRLQAGKDRDGTWYLWIISNGDPAMLTDDNHLDVLHDLADAPDHDLEQGYRRLYRAINTMVQQAYGGDAEAAEYWLDWRIQAEYLIHGRTDADVDG